MARGASPAPSLQGFDISGALAGEFDDKAASADAAQDLGFDIFDDIAPAPAPRAGADSDDDDVYIAAQQAALNRRNAKALPTKKGGSFQSFGLNSNLAKAISRKGFTIPTPIQRKTIPVILEGHDVVGMARTGSGKTAAFVIPMLEKLKAHSAKVGARGVILSPSRELALQTLKVVKELGRGTDLRTILLVGGDSLEEQFGSMASNPDIIIATPGRFEHLKVEMGLELSSIKYVVFDEADRLFEMGFAAQLTEIIHSLPPNRQTLLFSATLPKTLVEFARAGLQEPKLIRLDSEGKVSPDLQSAFFMMNTADKEGALLHVLRDVIKMPGGPTENYLKRKSQAKEDSKKRKRGADKVKANETPTPHSTIVFAATKHHVDYLANLLKLAGYATSYVYGSLDQTARKMQVEDFRTGMTNLLVVTDVAARGIDIPILANVINYDLPPQPKVFVHRVGRTARAGKTGWSYNFVTQQDLPYLMDLQLFLGGKFIIGRESKDPLDYHTDIVLAGLSRQALEPAMEDVAKIISEDTDLAMQREVAGKGEKQYLRTRTSASAESAKRAKAVASNTHIKDLHPMFGGSNDADMDALRDAMLAKVSGFRPAETIFEVGKRGQLNDTAEMIKRRRDQIHAKAEKKRLLAEAEAEADSDFGSDGEEAPASGANTTDAMDLYDDDDDSDMEVTITQPSSKKSKTGDGSFKESEFFMGYLPTSVNAAEDAAYQVNQGSDFVSAARHATMDLNGDEDSGMALASKATGLRWDKKSKRYVARANDIDGSRTSSKGKGGMMKSESGLKIPASMKSGRFEAWKKANRVGSMPKVGEQEKASRFPVGDNQRWKHKQTKAPKALDKYRDDYHKKKKVADEKAKADREAGIYPAPQRKGKAKSEIRGVDDVAKLRAQKDKRKEKNARPAKRR